MTARTTREEFIEKAIVKHGNKYDYSKVDYINALTTIIIGCPVHGDFIAYPSNFLRKRVGCPKCSANNKSLTTSEFIKKSVEVHGHKYDYSKVNYESTHLPITIVCPIHGSFKQKPTYHLKHGCNKCALDKRTYSSTDFIVKSNIVHNGKYDYSLVQYKTTHVKVDIVCPIHGIFRQTPNCHVIQRQGCPICANLKRGGLGGYSYEYFRHNRDQLDAPGILYAVQIHNKCEIFIKVGITSKSVDDRYNKSEYKDMNIQILYEKQLPLFLAFCVEQQLLQDLKSHRFFPNIKFSGYTECVKNNDEVLAKLSMVFKK